jgi:hypothetical protein
MSDWSVDIECVLENIRVNSVVLSTEHKKRYFYLNETLRYFRLPVIFLSGVNSVISVGFQTYIDQATISLITCVLALSCSIIGSIELYLSIQKSMENELLASKSFYLLSVDIFKTLSLTEEHRPIPAKEYLETKYQEYIKLIENSNMLSGKILDKLAPIPEIGIKRTISQSPSGSLIIDTNI